MKRFASMLLVLITINTQAQKKERLPLVFRIGFAISDIKTDDPSVGSGTGVVKFEVGVETIIPITKNKNDKMLAFNPCVLYLPTGYNPEKNAVYKSSVKYISLQLPLIFLKSSNKTFFLGAGPFVNFALSGKNQSFSGTSTSMKFGNSITDDRKRIDVGGLVKAGKIVDDFIFGSKNGIAFGLQYNIGLIDVTPNDKKSTAKGYLKTSTIEVYTAFVF